ncbi:MAG TPA: response regulator, partial [Polyangiales bacterium]|nr:response regulator [Polyangiales bacterium]
MSEPLPRVLLVDDEPNVIEGIIRRLRREFEFFEAYDGAQALALLEREKPMHIIVSDMRMPGMNGAHLLAEACKRYPDMVRMLLTGQSDLDSAIAAINDGQIFRFLLKPCPGELLRLQLMAALRQHELIVAERVLLQQTLNGAVQALSEVLSLAMPEAFGKATRIRDRARKLVDKLKIADGWRIEVAATLSQVGAVTLGPQTATKLYHGRALSPEEQIAVDRLPGIAIELLKPIPRMQPVRDLITHAFGAHGGSAPRELEAQVLRACVEYDASQDSGLAGADTIAQLKRKGYDSTLLDALSELVAVESSPARVIDVAILDLRPGMVLAEDVYSAAGTLLLARGHSIKENVIERLRTILPNLAGRHAVRVRLS